MNLKRKDAAPHTRRQLLQGVAALVPLLLSENPASAQDGDLVLVLGASGLIGQYVSKELMARGYRVRGVTRKVEEAKEKLGRRIDWVSAELSDPSTLASAMPGVSKVIFVAGARGQGGVEKNRKIYAEAVGELARLSTIQGVDKFILLSSGGVTLDSPSWPEYIKDVLFWKSRGENLLRASGTPYSIVRCYSLAEEDEAPSRKANGKRGTSTGDLQLYQGDRPDVGGLISRHDLAVVTVEAMEHSPPGDGKTSQGTTFEVIDRELQYYQCEQGTCVGRVQPRKEKKRGTTALVAKSPSYKKAAGVAADYDSSSSSSSSVCSSSEEIDCEWREALRRLPLDKPR